jgi:hypothetical protein
MNPILCAVLWAGWLLGDACPSQDFGFVYQPAYCLDEVLRTPAEPYRPQPGDIMLCTDRLMFWKITFTISFAGDPHHSGVVFRRPDGGLALLEAGPHDSLWCRVLDVSEHLHSYEEEGPVWIRRRRTPLTEAQSDCLTNFALAQDGKRFAIIRLGAQLTPFRSRGPLSTYVMGKPKGSSRHAYFCCELLMESLVAAGLLDPATTRPAATYPRDVFFDRSLNHYINKHLDLSPCWYPPSRWTSSPCQTAGAEKPAHPEQ